MTGTDPAAGIVAAWQNALAAEHRAFFAYALLGPRLPADQQQLARACYAGHRALRDATQAAIAATGRTPVAPHADYPDLYPVTTSGQARAVAIRVEQACADAWRYLYAQAAAQPGTSETGTPGGRPGYAGLRSAAQDALTSSAVSAANWRALVDPAHATEPFPGV